MSKLFRKIRQNLLSEGKTSKYLKYAIGEIALVVIGILIALQINNWNENRKQENSKQHLMLAIKKELATNKEHIEDYLKELNKSNANFNKVLLYSIGKDSFPVDSLRYYLSNMEYPRLLSLLSSVREGAINSGKFELLSDSLKQSLSMLKDYTDSRKSINNISNEIVNSGFDFKVDRLLNSLYLVPEIPSDLALHSPIPKHPDFILNDADLITLVKDPETYLLLDKIYVYNIADEIWMKFGLADQTNKTLNLIDKELSND